ncbi:WW domain-containing adapter protein with coiled-coil-like isoform X1 [Branchiostoma lanceolatum]|uniref:WW domain-containing adapter protein with coiled-coil-like isoform X1 n=1 Tax=Branchiostoma lanceolatum TaxID=7740 RepID=UPI003454CBDE
MVLMVMHARKYPRLNDGYHDRSQAHPYQSAGVGKYPSKRESSSSYNDYDHRIDRVRDSPSKGFNRTKDSPGKRNSPWESRDRDRERERERDRERDRDRDRYKNKSSYSERYREKERERERRERERARYSPGDWDRPHRRDREDRRGTSDSPAQNAANHQPRQGNSAANHSQTQPTAAADRKNDTDAGKKNAEHTQSSTATTSTAPANTKAFTKVKCDWSEHISSSGKKYYYNCKTEVSQWEKPPGWQESPKDSGESKQKDKPVAKETASSSSASSSSVSHGTNSREAGSSSATGTPSSSNHKHSTDPSPRNAGQPNLDRHKDTSKSHNRTGTPSSSQGTPSAHRGTPGQGSDRMDISTTPEHLQTFYRSRTESPAVQNTPSPGTPSLGRAHSTPHTIPQSLVQQLFPPTSNASSISQVHNVGVEQSLQLLQHATLLTQQALQAQQQQQPSTTVPPSNVSDSSPVSMRTSISDMSSPYQSQLSPHPSSSQQPEAVTSTASPAHSVHSQKSVGSHADGAVSSSYSVVHGSTPSAVQTVLPPAIELTPSLVKYFRESLIRHTQGWQAEHAERQAQRLDEEGHAMGSLHSSQVSVDLKFARSLVRVSEIQATLQEQRILFLRQQIQHLEKMKNQNMFPS